MYSTSNSPATHGWYFCCRYRALILVFTFLIYTAYHLSRKPISVVKVCLIEFDYIDLLLIGYENFSLHIHIWCNYFAYMLTVFIFVFVTINYYYYYKRENSAESCGNSVWFLECATPFVQQNRAKLFSWMEAIW